MARYAGPGGGQDLLLADPQLIDCTKAAWLGSSPDCRRSRQERERCGARRWWQASGRGSGQGGSGEGSEDGEVVGMEPGFKKQSFGGLFER